MVSSQGSMPKILIKKILFTLIIIFFSSCVNNSPTIDERIVIETKEYISFTGTILSETGAMGAYKCQNLKGESYNCFSKIEDLSYLKGEEFLISGVLEKGKLEITKKEIIEKEIIKEPFEYKNSPGGYGFFANTKKLTVIKGGSKTIIKNGSGNILIKIFSYSNDKIPQDAFISNGGKPVEINGIKGEIKELNGGFDIWLKNRQSGYLINLQTSSLANKGDDFLIVKSVLDTFIFVDRDRKTSKIKCGGSKNTLCPSGYFCELTSDTGNNGKCIMIGN